MRQYPPAGGLRGMHVTVGAEGACYRQQGDGSPSRSESHADENGRLVEVSAADTLQQLNQGHRTSGRPWMVIAGGAIVSILSLPTHFLLSLFLLCLTLAMFLLVRKADAPRRIFFLEYRLEAGAKERWTLLNHSLAALARTDRMWRITTHSSADGRTQRAGASPLVRRMPATVQRKPAATLASNVMPYCLNIPGRQFFFFPDRLYILHRGIYEAVEYPGLRLAKGETRFIEEQEVPKDAQIVGKRWQHGKSSKPFGFPITRYGVIELTLPSGLNVHLHVSSVGVADQFVGLFQAFQRYGAPPSPDPSQDPVSTTCYEHLGLSPSCTKEEARAAYRNLVMANHPDRMNRTDPQVQERANTRLQEIIHAYKDLKRLHDWS